MINKQSIYAFLLATVFILSACGSNDKEDGIINPGGISVVGSINSSINSMTIDTGNGNFSTEITVSSGYADSVVATLNNMDVVLNNCPIIPGTLSVIPNSVELNSTSTSENLTITGTLQDPACKPTAYQITGTTLLLQDGQSITETFATESIAIPLGLIVYAESVTNLKLEVLDKRIDINETNVTEQIRLRVTEGNLGAKDKGIKISSIVTHGSFSSLTVQTDDAGDAIFNYISPTPMVDNNLTIEFCLEENTSICDTTVINLTTTAIIPPVEVIDDINYFITFVPTGGAYNLSLDARNNAIVTLIDKDTKEPIADSSIKSITVTSQDPSILKLTPEGGGEPVASIGPLSGRNGISVLMTADKLNAGLAPIAVVIEYTNKNGQLQTRGQLFSMAIISGEPTAFSINSNGVVYNEATKQFEHQFIVQATDASSNPISSTGVINVSAMASFAKDANGREILYGRFSDERLPASGKITANLTPDGESARLDLVGGLTPFNTNNIDENRAFVAVFGGVNTYEANGKWNIEKGSMAGDTLKLSNAYAGEDYTELGMAVGYNFRDKFCTSAYEEAVIVVDSTDGTYQLNEDGQAVVTVKHDAYMIGKRVMLMVNMTGLNPQTGEVLRSGEVHEVTLSFHEPLRGNTFPINKGAVNQRITLAGVIDAGPDSYSVINSTFSCVIKTAEGITGIALVDSNDPASCASNGIAYLTFEVNATADGGSVTFEECQVNDESKF